MKDNIVQIRTKNRVVKYGNEQNYFYGRIMLAFNEILQDFANSSKSKTFNAIIRNVIFDEVEEDNIVVDENSNSSIDGKITKRKIISFSDKAYTVKYSEADLLYKAKKKVVSSCAVHNEIKQFSLSHDTRASETHYPNAIYEADIYDYSDDFTY